MSGAVAQLSPCVFMTWTGKNFPFTVKLMKLKSQGHSLARAPYSMACVNTLNVGSNNTATA